MKAKKREKKRRKKYLFQDKVNCRLKLKLKKNSILESEPYPKKNGKKKKTQNDNLPGYKRMTTKKQNLG